MELRKEYNLVSGMDRLLMSERVSGMDTFGSSIKNAQGN
jgi:hypothetical protein